jgi:DNA polymerase-3 subunit alpha
VIKIGFAKSLDILKNKAITLDSLKDLYENCSCEDMTKYWGAFINIKSSPYMIVGQNPTFFNDDKNSTDKKFQKFYFQDSNNLEVLKKAFSTVGINVEDCYITNLCKCATKDNCPLMLKNAVECFEAFMIHEIKLTKPRVIFLLGKPTLELFKNIVDSSDMLKERIFPMTSGFELDSNKIFYTALPHPAARFEGKLEKMIAILKKYENIFKLIDRDREFNHLHIHNHFSLHDSLIRIEDLVRELHRTHKKQIVTTNHGSLSDNYQIIKNAEENGLKYILGCELYCFENVEEFKKIEDATERGEYSKTKRRHIVLIAKNKKGYENLIKNHNWGWLNGFYYRPVVDLQYILDNSEGLIALSACTVGLISYYLVNNDFMKAYDMAKKLKSVFKDDFYIEIPLIEFEEQVRIADDLISIAKELQIKIVVTNDVHYIKHEDSKFRDFAYDIFHNKTESDSKSDKKCDDLYFKSYLQMKADWELRYKSKNFTEEVFEEAIDNAIAILNSIEVVKLTTSHNIKMFDDSNERFVSMLNKAFVERFKDFNDDKKKLYRERLDKEIEIILKKDLVDYFLIMADIVNYARTKYGRYVVGPGRGSASGSLVNYLLDVTLADPIRFDLLFERFVGIERSDLPDIDVDFMPSIRDDVFVYIKNKYGENKCIQIGTHAYLKTKNAIQDVSRYFNVPAREVYELTTNLEEIEEQKTTKEIKSENPLLEAYFKKYPKIEQYVDKMRNTIRQFSSHAAGIIVSNENVYETMPINRTSRMIVTGWQDGSDFRELTDMGYYKYDILGLNNLEIVNDAVKLIGKDINFEELDLEDPKVYKFMSEDDYMGIFQFESALARKSIKSIGPTCFEDYVAINSLLRPGPLKAGMVDEYAKRKKGIVTVDVPSCIEPILRRTYGIIVEQEQIMKICNVIGGLDLNEANNFRKALVKYSRSLANEMKRIAKVQSYEKRFIESAKNFVTEKEAEDIFKLIGKFVAYGFNRSHSLAYALVAYWEMYIKTYYPKELYLALLNNTSTSIKDNSFEFKLKRYLISAVNHGFNLLPPDVNKSDMNFKSEGDDIRYGLVFLKSISPGDCSEIIKKRPFVSLEDFYSKVEKKKLNKSKVESLIFSGAFDSFGKREDVLKKFYEIRKDKDKVDLTAIDYKVEEKERLYISLSGMIEFFERCKLVNEKHKLEGKRDYFIIDAIMKKKGYAIASVYSRNRFFDRMFFSGKKEELDRLDVGVRFAGVFIEDSKGVSCRTYKVDKNKTEV